MIILFKPRNTGEQSDLNYIKTMVPGIILFTGHMNYLYTLPVCYFSARLYAI